ncbi:HupE/UreJ family protein [Jannaschia sp. R86511]|uniref:HupE/UreJ family protein n=1 Tax=Jannaschia sp. R86511 TaxID=3093853 RepID=UPI0036D34514
MAVTDRSTGRPTRLPRLSSVGVATALLVLVPASAAHAHGLRGISNDSPWGFLASGIEHMLLGWDHLLFIAGVLLVSKGWRVAAEMISLFALGHSITLILATMSGWQVNATFVDVVIGLSVVYVGFLALRGRRPELRIFAAVVFAFGLIHGLGLSTRLQALDLPEEGLLLRVIAFNVGIEIGQLIAIAGIVGLTMGAQWMWRTRNQQQPQAVQVASIALVLGGVVAAGAVAGGALIGEEDEVAATAGTTAAGGTTEDTSAAAASGSCTEGERTIEFPATGGHTAKAFFEPGEEAPLGDIGHSLGDGYVAYLYRADLPAEDVDALRQAVENAPNSGILAGPVTGQEEAVLAVTQTSTLTCAEADHAALDAFTTAWFTSLEG